DLSSCTFQWPRRCNVKKRREMMVFKLKLVTQVKEKMKKPRVVASLRSTHCQLLSELSS
ncbi:unnamed protein product, partial [Amoebophrya sp. A120]